VTPAERIVALREDLRTAAARFCDACTDLGPLARELAALEGQLRAAEAQAGIFDHSPPARELAAAVALGALDALRPHIQFVGSASAAGAEAQLRRTP